jgi:hypothetical protein
VVEYFLRMIRKLFTLTPRETGDLLVAQAYLLGAWWTVRRRPRGELLRPVESPPPGGVRNDARLTRLVVAVDRMSRFGLFRPTCLVRAVALERWIHRAHAGPAVVRVGVLRVAGELFAHAWIELEGQVIGDEATHVRRFTPLHDFSALA